MRIDVVDVAAKRVVELFGECFALDWAVLLGGEFVPDAVHHGQVQPTLVPEVVRDESVGDPRLLRDLGGGDVVVRPRAEELTRCLEEQPTTVRSRTHIAGHDEQTLVDGLWAFIHQVAQRSAPVAA